MGHVFKEIVGKDPSGKPYEKYTIKDSSSDNYVTILNYACAIQSIVIHDKKGDPVDVVLGYDTYGEYVKAASIFGAVIGRCANRISNAEFILNGKLYKVGANEGKNSLHGGNIGFNQKIWDASIKDDALHLQYLSKDGEEGYPGNLLTDLCITFDDSKLKLVYDCVSDEDTVVNITNHSFFNMSGHSSGSVLSQKLKIFSNEYCVCGEDLLLTGELKNVKGTPFDFRELRTIEPQMAIENPMLSNAGGYDLCYSIDGESGKLREAAELLSEKTGICMKTYTDLPAMQLYSGMALGAVPFLTVGKNGARYAPFGGICFETQGFPDAVNITSFPSVIQKAEKHYFYTTIYEFNLV